MIEIIFILKSLLIGWFLSRFEPLQMIVDMLPSNFILNVIKMALTCSKCITFWYSLIVYQNIYIAIISCFLMIVYEKTIGKWEKRIEF